MPEADPNRLVHCIKLDRELPGLTKPPFPNEMGQLVFEKVSKEGVDLSSRDGAEFMLKQLRIWMGLEEGDLAATAWTPPSE
ncbi:MAG: Fe(2+)-trafficking protein [Deltaproteobacteria bacterium]|nr:Fe(2+)-trafficking protein [Deltaproteobacteria bacterium]